MDFKRQYFSIWQEVWNLHKRYYGIRADDEEEWKRLNDECETLDAKYEGKPEQKFLQSLLLSVAAELERNSKGGK